MNPLSPETPSAISRRRFIVGTGASVLAFSVLRPELMRGAEANSKVNLGLIGCGSRGKRLGDLFQKHGGYNLVAAADYFQDRVDQAGELFKIPAAQRFTGLSAYRRLLEQKVDAVLIETPPYFHPEHAAAAVEAGKHVFLAKPIAVDVPGCLSIEASGRKATARKLCFLVDFQTRANKLYQDAARCVHEGELGKIVSAEASYQSSLALEAEDKLLRTDPKNPELRLRAWNVDRTLSGEPITEQSIHAVDVASWMLDAEPLQAVGTGGRARDYAGNCWDHFSVIYYYPNDVILNFNCKQFGYGYDDILCRVYGLKGSVDTHYFGRVTVKALEYHSDGAVGEIYVTSVITNIANFYDNITKGEYSNPSVPPSVRSNLTTILGRTAAHKNGLVTWKEMMRANEKFVADLKGLKA
jgi:predicted dehydrogenase